MGKKGGGGGNVSGFKYSLGMLMGLCRGPIDELVEIKVGDLVAWASGGVTSNTRFLIDNANLFGGETKEGGIFGNVDVMMGDPTQDLAGTEVRDKVLGSTVATVIADGSMVTTVVDGVVTLVAPIVTSTVNFMSSLRGVATLYFNGQICANNPYPKKWTVRVRRLIKGWHGGTAWYPDEAVVALFDAVGNQIFAMNPAHIIYECLTNPVWGRGLAPSQIDETSFISAANTLCREKFGLCLAWTRSTDLGQFMQIVFDHVGAAMYPDRTTGLQTIRLLRKDYVVSDLPIFDYSSGLLSIDEDLTTAPDNSHSEIIVNWTDPVTNNVRQTRVQNLAGTQANQTVTSTKVDYLGIPTADLAARVAQRDLALQASGIKRYTLKFDRRGRKITPAGVFRINVPDRNIFDMVLRAGTVTEGAINDQTITVVALQDLFGLADTVYLKEPERAWIAPDRSVIPIAVRDVREINYRDTVRALTAADLATVPVDSGDVVTVAAPPTSLSTNYELNTHGTGEAYADHGSFLWTPSAKLFAGIGYYDTSITIYSGNGLTNIGILPVIAWLDQELVEVTSYDATTGIMEIGRGCVDTIPWPHDADARIWFPERAQGSDTREYTLGEVVDVKMLTRTNTGVLDISLAAEDTFTIAARQGKPYAPGNFQIGGNPFANVTLQLGDEVFTWAHRDRINQADHVLVHGDASTGPEAGVTYTARVYSHATGALLRTTTGITAATWTYTTSMQSADSAPSFITIKLRAERDGIVSFQEYVWSFFRAVGGYGKSYGLRYG